MLLIYDAVSLSKTTSVQVLTMRSSAYEGGQQFGARTPWFFLVCGHDPALCSGAERRREADGNLRCGKVFAAAPLPATSCAWTLC